MTWSIGVDIGGTFTDFFAEDTVSGRVVLAKRPSTRDIPGRALLLGLGDLAAEGVPLDDVVRLAHGTTVATNALIQGRGGRVALLTTAGFRDLLEIGRQIRPHMYDLYEDYPPPVVARPRRFEVIERITAGGIVVTPLTDVAIDDAVRAVARSDAQACAVCLLFAFQNPAHERRLGEALRAALPNVRVSLSSEVQAEFREYERFSTTAVNAYLQPVMDEYMTSLEQGLVAELPNARVGINQSSGGLMSPERARAFPVRTALSGPAAGVVGAVDAALAGGFPSFISLDMGGTSADVSLVKAGRFDLAYEREVAGFPIRLPSVDIHTVGAGGGSIAWFERDGLLKVGPESAGAEPGPACYGNGGTRPTVTDANLVLGRLSDGGLIGGKMALDPELASGAIQPLASRLGYTEERGAQGILGIVVANMVRAIRTISVERGYDPRDFALMPFGGAGPLHAREVAAALGIRHIVVPPAPGIICAQGLLIADLKENFVTAAHATLDDDAEATYGAAVDVLIGQARAWLEEEGVAQEAGEVEVTLDARYVGQNFELSVPLAERGPLTAFECPDASALRLRFLAEHELAYGYSNPDDPVEIVNIRLTVLARVRESAGGGTAAPVTTPPIAIGDRPIWFDDAHPVSTPIFERGDLSPGQMLPGPAVVQQLDATSLVYPGDSGRIDSAGNLVITLDELSAGNARGKTA